MIDLFISYASVDRARAEALNARLSGADLDVWFDTKRLRPGARWDKEIDAACEAARVMLPLITPRWKGSEWTRYETYFHGAVIPVLAEGDPKETLTPPLRGLHAISLDPLTAAEADWQALIAAIRAKLAEPAPERAPRLVDLPYPANPFFAGREDDLVRLHEALHEAPVAALTQSRVSAIAAMGGIGKTTLANEYARRYWRLYPQILWVDARRGYESEYALLFDKLFPERTQADLERDDKARQVLAELNGHAERLLVIDNAEDAETVRPWLPRAATSGCRTLITSRFADWPQAESVRTIHLNVLEPDAARQLLVLRTGRSAEGAERTACDALAKVLGYLPLALEQAAAYIAAPGTGATFADYLRLFEVATADLLGRGVRGSTEYPDSVLGTWRMTVAQLTPESRAILRLCAWYADTPIPQVLVLQGAKEVLLLARAFVPVAPLGDAAGSAELRMRDALTGLARYSMILDTTDDTFRVHGLVQAVEREQAAKDGQDAKARAAALKRLTAAFLNAFNDPAAWPLCRQLLPHQQIVVDRLKRSSKNRAVPVLLNLAGRFLDGSGDAASALPLYRRALESRERVLGPAHVDTLTSVNNLAGCLETLGKAPSALPLYRRALKSRALVLGPGHPDTLGSVNNLAVCLEKLGKAPLALRLYRCALESSDRLLGPDHLQTLGSVNNLASCLQTLGRAPLALPLYCRALDSRERVLGSEHLDTLTSVNNLASCLQALDDAPSALPLYHRALDSSERLLGPEHPRTLTGMNNLADCLETLGKAASALPLYYRALEGRERVLGPDHPDTLGSLNNLALCQIGVGDAALALPLCRHGLERSECVLDPEHPQTLISVNTLAFCLEMLGDAPSALPLYRRALKSRKRVLGPEHPQALVSMSNLAGCLKTLGKAKLALRLYRRTLEIRERVLGSKHRDTLASVNNLACCLVSLGDAASALPLYRRALEGSERVLGPEHPQTLSIMNNLADYHEAVGQLVEAGALRRRIAKPRVAYPDVPHGQDNLAARRPA